MTDKTRAEVDNIPDGMMPEPDLTDLPPLSLLPKSVHKLYEARETAYERYVDFESEHYELLAVSWESAFARRDEEAGRQAVADGVDPLSIPSPLEEAKAKRPRIVGALREFVSAVTRADQALYRAVRLELGPIGERIEERVSNAADAYVEAQRKADEARMAYGAALTGRGWWTDTAKLMIRAHYRDATSAVPLTFEGTEARDLYDQPLRGAAEVKVIDESYGRAPFKPKATIRSKTNGQVLEIDAEHAASLVRNGSAEWADPDNAPAVGDRVLSNGTVLYGPDSPKRRD